LEKKSSNDSDRLMKYLARFDLRFEDTKLRWSTADLVGFHPKRWKTSFTGWCGL